MVLRNLDVKLRPCWGHPGGVSDGPYLGLGKLAKFGFKTTAVAVYRLIIELSVCAASPHDVKSLRLL